MLSIQEIHETQEMIDREHLDIRTVTMGISLRGCIHPVAAAAAERIYSHICRQAEHLVPVCRSIEQEMGIPIVNKRISVTPVALIAESTDALDYTVFAEALDRAAKSCGIDFIGGFFC